MTTKTLRRRLSRAGWSNPSLPCVNRIISAGREQNAVIITRWRSAGGYYDRHEQVKRACRALGLGYTEGGDTVVLDDRSLKVLSGIRDEWKKVEAKRNTNRP